MTRFAGLPDRQNAGPQPGARFTNLPEQLASMSRPENIDRIRAAAKGEAFTGRLGTTKTEKPTAAAPKPSAQAATAPKKPLAKTPQPAAIAIPADVAARGPKAVAAYEAGYARAMVRGAELSRHPAVAGRSAEAMQLFSQGKSNAEIVAHLTREQRASAADDMWARAYQAASGEQVAPKRPSKAKAAATDAMWDRARASIDGSRAASAADQKPAAGAKSSSADDIWTRAYAAVAR